MKKISINIKRRIKYNNLSIIINFGNNIYYILL